MKRMWLVVAMVLALGLAGAAQEKKTDKKPAGKPPAEAGQQGQHHPSGGMMSRNVAELKKMEFLVGTWTTAEKMYANEFMPQEASGTGRAEVHPGPGGLSYVQLYHSETQTPFGKFSGQAVMWYDQKAQAYKSFWCDSMSGCENNFGVGKWDGDKLVFTGESEYEGKKISMKQTFTDIKPNSFTWSEEASVGDGPMKPSMTIHYTRKSGPKAAEKPNPKL